MHLPFQFIIPLLQVFVPLDGRLKEIYDGGIEEEMRSAIKSKPSFQTQTLTGLSLAQIVPGNKKRKEKTWADKSGDC